MVFNVFICFYMFFDIFHRWRKLAACAQFKIQNSEFKIQNSKFAKVFLLHYFKEHLEAQLRHTLWQTLRVCQSFFLHYFKRAFISTIAPHTLANFKSLPKFFFTIKFKTQTYIDFL